MKIRLQSSLNVNVLHQYSAILPLNELHLLKITILTIPSLSKPIHPLLPVSLLQFCIQALKHCRLSSRSEASMDSMRGQGGIQMLLTAEQEAQQIVYAARNVKMTRLRQAKEEAEMEVTNYRSHLEAEYKQKLSETSGNSDSTEKRLEVETEQKIQHLKKAASEVSPDVIAMLTKYKAEETKRCGLELKMMKREQRRMQIKTSTTSTSVTAIVVLSLQRGNSSIHKIMSGGTNHVEPFDNTFGKSNINDEVMWAKTTSTKSMIKREQRKWKEDQQQTTTKTLTQLELLTKYIMGAPVQMVNPMTSRAHYEDDEARRIEEDICYLANCSRGSYLSYSRHGRNQGWRSNVVGQVLRDREHNYYHFMTHHDRDSNKESSSIEADRGRTKDLLAIILNKVEGMDKMLLEYQNQGVIYLVSESKVQQCPEMSEKLHLVDSCAWSILVVASSSQFMNYALVSDPRCLVTIQFVGALCIASVFPNISVNELSGLPKCDKKADELLRLRWTVAQTFVTEEVSLLLDKNRWVEWTICPQGDVTQACKELRKFHSCRDHPLDRLDLRFQSIILIISRFRDHPLARPDLSFSQSVSVLVDPEIIRLKKDRGVEARLIEWEEFARAFLDRFFLLDLREAKVQEFINFKKKSMSVKEYSLKFTQLARYAPTIMVDNRSRMSKFVSGVADSMVKECRTAILIKLMDRSRLMVHT
ncbi:V-type proton ATPase subunit G [Capsicum annuum]|nr:V-type proton ATPase subunit G [Capsicum annuum]